MVEHSRFADGNYRLPRAEVRADQAERLWQERLPVLTGTRVRLRELKPADAAPLIAMLTTEEMTRFISPPPPSVEGFERFIEWTIGERSRGAFVGFAVTVEGLDPPVGIFQVRRLAGNFETAEWGFALAAPFWGTGVFEEAAWLALDFVFTTLKVHRLEARAALKNGRGNGALLKMGAVQEGILRKSLLHNGQYLDQVMYSILNEDWQVRAAALRVSSSTPKQIACRPSSWRSWKSGPRSPLRGLSAASFG